MKLLKKIAVGALALTMTAGFSSGVLAQTTDDDGGDAKVCVAPAEALDFDGALIVVIEDADFGEIAFDATTRTLNETISINVTDSRGVVGDWNVTISGTNFTSSNSTSFNIDGNLAMPEMVTAAATAPGTLSTNPASVPLTGVSQATIIQGDEVSILNVDFDFAESVLTVPASTLVGVYNSTLTVTITTDGDNSEVCNPEEEEEVQSPVDAIRNW